MVSIYQQRAGMPDAYIGKINPENGRVYDEKLGPDEYIGSVNYAKKEVHAHKFGPDEYLGRINDKGEVYAHRVGPDTYVARVEADGKIYRHVPRGRDEYVGRVDQMRHPVEGAAAWFLLFAPTFGAEEESTAEQGDDAA